MENFVEKIEEMGLGSLYEAVLDDIECTLGKAPYDVKKRLSEQIWLAAKGIGLTRTYRGIPVESYYVMLKTHRNTVPGVKMVMAYPLAESGDPLDEPPDEVYYGIIN